MLLIKVISKKLAGSILISALILLAIFHLLILVGLLPLDIVWGGLIVDSDSDIIILEMISLFVTLLFILIVTIRLGFIWKGRFKTISKFGMWALFVFFLLNTGGNLSSGVSVENLIFAPLTIILAISAFILAIEK